MKSVNQEHVSAGKTVHLYGTATILFFMYSFTLQAIIPQDTQKQACMQQIGGNAYLVPDYFHQPLSYSHKSFKLFLTRVFNNRQYPQNFLALNFIHVISGISLAPKNDQPRRYMRKLLSLFAPKMQNIYINPYAFSQLLDQIPLTIAPFCNIRQEKFLIIDAIKECVYSCLVDDFTQLKNDPETTLRTLAHSLYDIVTPTEDRDISIRELQHAYHYFCARGLGNLVWSPSEQSETWFLVKTLAKQLEKCTEYNLLDEEMLDDLFWVLLDRFAFFIDLCASDLDQHFFDTVYYDLKTEKAALWLAQEREEFITTKLAFLQNVLMEAEIKSRASASGFLI